MRRANLESLREGRLRSEHEPRGRPALLVVDFSSGFTDPARVIGAARGEGLPMIFTAIEENLRDDSLWIGKAPALAGERVELAERLGGASRPSRHVH